MRRTTTPAPRKKVPFVARHEAACSTVAVALGAIFFFLPFSLESNPYRSSSSIYAIWDSITNLDVVGKSILVIYGVLVAVVGLVTANWMPCHHNVDQHMLPSTETLEKYLNEPLPVRNKIGLFVHLWIGKPLADIGIFFMIGLIAAVVR